MQLILKKITYNAVAASGTKLNFLIPSPILYPQYFISTLLATSGVPISGLDGPVQLHLTQHFHEITFKMVPVLEKSIWE